MDLTVDITKLQNYAKIKQTSDLTNAILRGGIDFAYCRKELDLGKTSGSNLIFRSDKSRRNQYFKDNEFFDVKNKKPKNVQIYSAYKELKHRALKFLTADWNSLIKSYTVKLSNDLKFLTRFLNDVNKGFMDEYAKEFERKNIIFVHDPNCKSGYIRFKFDFTREYIKQFLLSFSLPDFNKFVHESIKHKIKTDLASKTRQIFKSTKLCFYIYIPWKTSI